MEPDAAAPFEIYLMDVGKTMYGDAIVCRINGKTLWIDAGHPQDFHLLAGQAASIFAGSPPYPIDLLVVTHCHLDHIGCLPELLEEGLLDVKTALIADEKLGFPLKAGFGEDSAADRSPAAKAAGIVLDGLREEIPVLQSDAEIATFLADAVSQYDRYLKVIKLLEDGGATIVRYGRDANQLANLEAQIRTWGITVLGPTLEHLLLCSQELLRLQTQAKHDLVGHLESDLAESPVGTFRRYVEAVSGTGGPSPDAVAAMPFLADREGAGACLNDHSIVLKLRARGQSVLLTGDQQLAKAEVPGLDQEMSDLLETIRQAGPYIFWKTSHHTSYNGVDDDVLAAIGASYLGHSGGLNDPSHPDPSVLALLRDHKNLIWARTERNGLVRVVLTEQGVKIDVSRGELNDTRVNPKPPKKDLDVFVSPATPQPTVPGEPRAPGETPAAPPASRPATSAAGIRVLDGPPIEVVTRVSQVGVRVRVAIEVEEGDGRPFDPDGRGTGRGDRGPFRLARGRTLPPLAFVTEPARLTRKIGEDAAREILDAVRSAGHTMLLLNNPASAEAAAAAIRPSIKNASGVVILGGLDVVPSGRVQVISDEEVQELARLRNPFADFPDGFCVWSDDSYGDFDGDGIPELPISRVPDGGDASFMRAVLDVPAPARAGSRAGLHNVRRPFAKQVFSGIPGTDAILTSQPTRADGFPDGSLRRNAVYLMLHGSAEDPASFEGEFSDDGESWWAESALGVDNIDVSPGAVVFAGCCYGALSALPIAKDLPAGSAVKPFSPMRSIALKFLAGGANAFVGPTAVHFSPPDDTPDLAGGRLHRFFWERVAGGDPPALALHEARKRYVAGIPILDAAETQLQGGDEGPIVLHAVERKTFQMFSCLGLGW